MFKVKLGLKIATTALILPLLLSGCVKEIPAPTAQQSLTAALILSNFYNYSSDMTVTNINNSNSTESRYQFYLTTDMVKYVGMSPNEFTVYFARNPQQEDIWNFYEYNYLSTGNSINLGYNFYPDNTDSLSELSKLCGRFDTRQLVRSYFTHQGDGVFAIVDDAKSKLNYNIFNSLATYTLNEFVITVTAAKISHIKAVYNKIGSSDSITYNVDYAYNITLASPVAFIKNIIPTDTAVSFEINEDLLTSNFAEIRKLILFSGTVAPEESECLYVYDEGTDTITARSITLDNALASGTYSLGAWILSQDNAIDYYQSTFFVE